MVSGDPGYYSLLPWLKKQFPECPLTVIPGISSVQAAYCALAQPWQGSEWLSFHGRVPDDDKLMFSEGRKLSFLTDGVHNPAFIAEYLMGKGWPGETPASACEHLSYENQHIVTSTLSEIAKLDGFEESVMVVG